MPLTPDEEAQAQRFQNAYARLQKIEAGERITLLAGEAGTIIKEIDRMQQQINELIQAR